MASLYNYLKKHKNILSCPSCRRKLYKVNMHSKDQVIMAEDFKPLSKDIPQPVNGDEMLCPFCRATLASPDGKRLKCN